MGFLWALSSFGPAQSAGPYVGIVVTFQLAKAVLVSGQNKSQQVLDTQAYVCQDGKLPLATHCWPQLAARATGRGSRRAGVLECQGEQSAAHLTPLSRVCPLTHLRGGPWLPAKFGTLAVLFFFFFVFYFEFFHRGPLSTRSLRGTHLKWLWKQP